MTKRLPHLPGLGNAIFEYLSTGQSAKLMPGNASEMLSFAAGSGGFGCLTAHAMGLAEPKGAQDQAVRTQAMLVWEGELSRQFDNNHIPHLAVRGAFLAPFYPKPSDRFLTDLDIVIPRKFSPTAISILKEWGAKTEKLDAANFHRGYWDGLQLFLPPPHKMLVELHVDLAPIGRYPSPGSTTPPIESGNMLAVQALAVILHASTHHFSTPHKALCDILLLFNQGLDWRELGRLFSLRRCWWAGLAFLLDLEEFISGTIPASWKTRALASRRVSMIRQLADEIHDRGGVYGRGAFARRTLLSALCMPDVLTATGAIMRGLDSRLISSKIPNLRYDHKYE